MQRGDKYVCDTCRFDIWHPVRHLDTSILGLYDDGRFPGRCILALKSHAEHYEQLDEKTWLDLSRDVQVAGRAIKAVTGAPRLNVAIMGNVAPHLHYHIFPRQPAKEPIPNRPPWEHPDPKRPLSPSRRAALIRSIASALDDESVLPTGPG